MKFSEPTSMEEEFGPLDNQVEPLKLYRFDDSPWPDSNRLSETFYYVKRETPAGYWVVNGYSYGEEQWVAKNGKKRLAYPTREEAMISYLHRKRFQLNIYNNRLNKAKRMKAIADEMAKELGVSERDRNDSKRFRK